MKAAANGIEIEYDCSGDADAPPLLLVMGLATQMIFWDEEFCRRLAGRGYRVIRFDNRDVGLSTRLDHLGVPRLWPLLAGRSLGLPIRAPYALTDMARDAVGLLDALGIRSAHVAGVSMGGMIAQLLAIHHPERVRSLSSIMSTTGRRGLPPPRPRALRLLFSRPRADREHAIARTLEIFRTIGSPGFPLDEERLAALAGQAYDRGFYPPGAARQLAAVLAARGRRRQLRRLSLPALVIHGREDPLVPLAAGLDTARAIPGCELRVIDGMGHNLPRALWPRLIDAIDGVAQRSTVRPGKEADGSRPTRSEP